MALPLPPMKDYYLLLCKKGHLNRTPTADYEGGNDKCNSKGCNEKMIWYLFIKSSEYQGEPGLIIKTQREEIQCSKCGEVIVVKDVTFKIPKRVGGLIYNNLEGYIEYED
jgi:hypothetical protein